VNRRATLPTQFLNRGARHSRVEPPRAGDGGRRRGAAARAAAFHHIVSSNLDEFFEIRVAGLKESIKLGLPEPGPDARPAAEVFDAVSREAQALVAAKYRLLNDIVPAGAGTRRRRFPRREEWNPAQRQWIREYFFRELLPVLTPIGLDPAHPFSARVQQEPQLRRRAGGARRLRPQLARRDPCRPARAAAPHSPAEGDRRRTLLVRVPVVDPARSRGRALPPA